MVTKEDVDKAKAAWYAAEAAAEGIAEAVAWSNYQKLKEAFENGKAIR